MSFGLLSSFSGNIPISGNLSVTVSQNIDITGAYMTATGGSITYYGNQKIHTFFGSGAFQVLSVGSDPNDGSQVRYMVIGGGGGGGRDMGGGGGAGGYQAATGFPVSVGTYTITVGAGGAGAVNTPQGTTGGGGSVAAGANGSPSIFSSVTCPGGGGPAYVNNNFGRAGGLSFTLASPAIEGWPYASDSASNAFCAGGAGAQFTGGGGGGSAHVHATVGGNGGPGGSGIVVIRYRYKT